MYPNSTTHYVVDFHHIDDYRCFRPLDEVWEWDWTQNGVEKLRVALEEMFKSAGWEGDGIIEVFFLPPFLNYGEADDTSCTSIYHVKQDNNGTSWLCIPRGCKLDWPLGLLSKKPRSEVVEIEPVYDEKD